MKTIEKVVMVVLILLMVLMFTYPLIISEIWNRGAGHKSSLVVIVDNIVDTVKNGKNYDKYVKEYVNEIFGEIVLSKMSISVGSRVDSNKYAYKVEFKDILSENFVIYVNPNGSCYDNLSEVLSTDPKFQHLYSEWVKKQVGLDDENVELGFTGNYDKPYIEFNKIEHLSEDYREIFENTHNLYLGTIIVNNYHINEQNYINCFNKIKDDIYLKYYFITGKPNEPYSLFVYIDNYRFIYNYPEEKIASVSKKNGETWTDY